MKKLLSTILLFALITTANISLAQTNDQLFLTLDEGYEMTIEGTSNVRDWDADVNEITGSVSFEKVDLSDLSTLNSEDFNSLDLVIPVRNIESDSGRLTKNLQKYLKIDDYPRITFSLIEIKDIEVNGDNSATITAAGLLKVAGVDYETDMNVDATVNNGKITFSGSQVVKMTDFGIDPPTAMLGSIRARDEVNISYSVTFSQ